MRRPPIHDDWRLLPRFRNRAVSRTAVRDAERAYSPVTTGASTADAADAHTIRGWPAHCSTVSSAIAGTDPESYVLRHDPFD